MPIVLLKRPASKRRRLYFHLNIKLAEIRNGAYIAYDPDDILTPAGRIILGGVHAIGGVGVPYYDAYSFRFRPAEAFDPAETVQQVLAVIETATGESVTLRYQPDPSRPQEPLDATPDCIREGLARLTVRQAP